MDAPLPSPFSFPFFSFHLFHGHHASKCLPHNVTGVHYSFIGENTEDEEELDSNDGSRQRKPWGCTHHFCPVALRDVGVLWPGNNEISLKYAITPVEETESMSVWKWQSSTWFGVAVRY